MRLSALKALSSLISICHFSFVDGADVLPGAGPEFQAIPVAEYTPGYYPRLSGYRTDKDIPAPADADAYLLCPRFAPLIQAARAAGWDASRILIAGADARRNPTDGSMTLGPSGLVVAAEQLHLLDAGYRTLSEIPLVPTTTTPVRLIMGGFPVVSAQGPVLPPVGADQWVNLVTGNLPSAPEGALVLVPNDGSVPVYRGRGHAVCVTGVPGQALGVPGKTDLFIV